MKYFQKKWPTTEHYEGMTDLREQDKSSKLGEELTEFLDNRTPVSLCLEEIDGYMNNSCKVIVTDVGMSEMRKK